MAAQSEIRNLIADLAAELQQLTILWQMAVLAACLLIAWQFARLSRARMAGKITPEGTLRIGYGSMQRLTFPVSALVLVVIARWGLGYFQPVKLLDVAIPLLFSLALIRVAVYMLRAVIGTGIMLKVWERAIAWTIWTGVALYITGLLPELLGLLDDFSFPLGRQRISVLLILQGILSVAVTMLLALWLGRTLEQRLLRIAPMDMSLRVVLAKLVRATLIVVGVMVALAAVGIDVTVLSVFGGALGVGLGFGLQKIASSYVSGFIILLDRSIRIGDMVTVDNRMGRVTQLTTRYIVVRGLDGTEAIIPNDTLITSTVLNHSYSDRDNRLAVAVQVSYATDLELAMKILADVALAHPRVLRDPEPKAFAREFADSGINLELGVWIRDPEEGQLNLKSDLNLEIWRKFKQHGIEIPFPQREVRLIGGAPQPGPASR
ncbi:MAG: mechanosensitive ion channel [Betaproteobacteria bacterium]|nr:mechanosensitive ion channel [Betaproteobacteria bacterium]